MLRRTSTSSSISRTEPAIGTPCSHRNLSPPTGDQVVPSYTPGSPEISHSAPQRHGSGNQNSDSAGNDARGERGVPPRLPVKLDRLDRIGRHRDFPAPDMANVGIGT